MSYAFLPDRAIVSVTGSDARTFLQNLVTCDVDALAVGEAAFGALLTPQGKILFDFFVVCTTDLSFPTTANAGLDPGASGNDSGDDETFLLDTALENAPALTKRLGMYRLRAKVVVTQTTKQVIAVWGATVAPAGLAYADPRARDLGTRVIVDIVDDPGDTAAYEAHRIALGVPLGGADFMWGDAFPHEVNMDLLHGVSFTKGCYVGQEVVSRMEHRGTTRRRIVRATFEGAPPAAGTEIRAGDVLLGTFGSAVAGHGLAAVRLDRLAEAQTAGRAANAGDTPLHLMPPT